MEDCHIVDLFWDRSEKAIRETDQKYGRMLTGISYSLLHSREDAEECVNDTYLTAWGLMPDDRPAYLGAFLSKIVRRISIDRFRSLHRKKRDGGIELLIDELAECIPDSATIEAEYENGRLAGLLNRFIGALPEEKRVIFVLRYFSSQPLSDIAEKLQISEGKVKTVLFRTRESLRAELEKEGLL